VTPQVTSTGTKATRVIGALALVGLGWLLLFGLVLSPPDENQGEAVRMLYLHVPTVWLAYLAFGVTALGSIFYLVPKTRSLAWDRLAGASAEIGVLGYLAIRRLPATPAQRANRCAIAGLIAFIDVPIVHLSVTWWRTLHQPATIKTIGDVEISGSMLFTLFVGLIAFTLVYIWLMMHKMRVMMMEDALDDHGLELALEERRAEAELQEVVP